MRRITRSNWHLIHLFLSLCFLYFFLADQQASSQCIYMFHTETAQVAGRPVTVELYIPDHERISGLVIMLHGSAGVFTLRDSRQPAHDNMGEKEFADACFAVALPHYFDALGRRSILNVSEMKDSFPKMLATVDSILTILERRPWARGKPVFLFGESLGGFLSVALGFSRNEVAAVSEYSGGLPDFPLPDHLNTPSLLISHGENDVLVPTEEARRLQGFCQRNGSPVLTDIYPGQGHILSQSSLEIVHKRSIDLFLSVAHRQSHQE